MIVTKELKEYTKNMKDKTPNYYIGKVYGYKAFDIIEDYSLNYNCATL